MSASYTPKATADITGASRQVLRVYTQRYARYLSTDATPAPGLERRFTEADLKVIAFVYQRTAAGETHEQVAERLAAGELEQFAWQAPETPPDATTAAESASGATGSMLIPLERLQAAHALMQDAQRREQAATEQIATLQTEVQRLSQALGRAEGEAATLAATLQASRYHAPKWWRAIFGGRQAE